MRGAERHEDGGDDVVDEVEEGGEEQAQVLAQPREPLLRVQTANTVYIQHLLYILDMNLGWIDLVSYSSSPPAAAEGSSPKSK